MLPWCRGQSSETFDLGTWVRNPAGAPTEYSPMVERLTVVCDRVIGNRRNQLVPSSTLGAPTITRKGSLAWLKRRPAKSVGPRPSQVQILLLAPTRMSC